jgi:ABC-type glycerol-3-phosphate transport system substrate-binding protein
MQGQGGYTYSNLVNQYNLPVEAVVVPNHPEAVERVLCPSPIGSWALSRRLADDNTKLEAAMAFVDMIMSTEGQIQAMDFYSGSLMSPTVYDDPRIEETTFGPVSKRNALGVWPVARYAGHHVANPAVAWTEVERCLAGEISVQEALANIDAQMQELENTALERLNA